MKYSIVILVGISFFGCSISRAETHDMFVISLGDIPTTEIYRRNIRSMESTPLDGVVLTANFNDPELGHTDTYTKIWRDYRISYDELVDDEINLRETHSKRLTQNFVRIDILPGNVDWFSPNMSDVEHNFRMMARLARNGGLKGIFFDTEPYQKPVFQYSRLDSKHTFDEYKRETQRWGARLMTAMLEEYPDIAVFLTHGYYVQVNDNLPLESQQYGLYPSFLDGMFEATGSFTSSRPKIINGNEQSYACRTQSCLDYCWKHSSTGLYRGSSPQFDKVGEIAFSIWLDRTPPAFSRTDLKANFFSPEDFETQLLMRLQKSERYVWVYSVNAQWFNVPKGEMLPAPYVRALAEAKRNLLDLPS